MPYKVIRKRCLIVDDDQASCDVARLFMEKHGYEVVDANNSGEALFLCSKIEFDCVIIDWNMEHTNGIEFLEKLVCKNPDDRPIIIFCTVRESEEDIKEAVSKGANGYIIKPFLSDDIQNKLKGFGVIL